MLADAEDQIAFGESLLRRRMMDSAPSGAAASRPIASRRP